MFTSFLLDTLTERLSQANVIIGMVLAIIGIAAAMLANRIACVARKQDKVEPDDKILVAIKIIGLMFIVVAMVVMIIE